MSKVCSDKSKISKQVIALQHTMAQNTPPSLIDRDVYIVREDSTEARNPAGQTPTPAGLSQTHEASILKGLNGPIPVTSQTSLSLVPCTPYMQLSKTVVL